VQEDRPDIRDRASLEANFRQKFEALNRVRLTNGEFARLLDDLVSPDVFKNSIRLRGKNDFTRDDGTPLSYTLVNWKARRVAELALMDDLVPLLKQRAAGREISGLNAYES